MAQNGTPSIRGYDIPLSSNPKGMRLNYLQDQNAPKDSLDLMLDSAKKRSKSPHN